MLCCLCSSTAIVLCFTEVTPYYKLLKSCRRHCLYTHCENKFFKTFDFEDSYRRRVSYHYWYLLINITTRGRLLQTINITIITFKSRKELIEKVLNPFPSMLKDHWFTEEYTDVTPCVAGPFRSVPLDGAASSLSRAAHPWLTRARNPSGPRYQPIPQRGNNKV